MGQISPVSKPEEPNCLASAGFLSQIWQWEITITFRVWNSKTSGQEPIISTGEGFFNRGEVCHPTNAGYHALGMIYITCRRIVTSYTLILDIFDDLCPDCGALEERFPC